MHIYEIVLTRWDSKKGEGRAQRSQTQAPDIASALEKAQIMVRAAGEADPSRVYEVRSVGIASPLGRTILADHGWMTDDEYSEAVAERRAGRA